MSKQFLGLSQNSINALAKLADLRREHADPVRMAKIVASDKRVITANKSLARCQALGAMVPDLLRRIDNRARFDLK